MESKSGSNLKNSDCLTEKKDHVIISIDLKMKSNPKATKSNPKTAKSDPNTQKSIPKTTKSDPKTTKSNPSTTKSNQKTTKSNHKTTKSKPIKDDDCQQVAVMSCSVFAACVFGLIYFILATRDLDVCSDCPRIWITSLEVSGNESAADITVGFVLDNNKHGGDEIKYSDIQASVYYNGSSIASASVYPFEQEPKQVTEKEARMRATNMDQIRKDWVSKAANKTEDGVLLSFDINISSRIQLPWTSGIADINVMCDGVDVKFTNLTMPTGSMLAGSKDCHLDVKDLRNGGATIY